MTAVRLEAPAHLAIVDWPEADAPREGEVLVRVRRVGVCATDHHSCRGRFPFFEYPRMR